MDGYRYVEAPTRRVMKAWSAREPRPDRIPWTPLEVELSRARVALISSAGIARVDDVPFDREREHRDPWWGDPSFRKIPRETRTGEVRIHHLHIDPRPGEEDLDCVLPLRRLDELAEAGVVGGSAPTHYSIMGWSVRSRELVEETAPRIAAALASEEVALALLVPV